MHDIICLHTYLRDEGGILDVHGELVSIPAEVRGPSFGVDGTKHAQFGGHYHIIFVTMSSQ